MVATINTWNLHVEIRLGRIEHTFYTLMPFARFGFLQVSDSFSIVLNLFNRSYNFVSEFAPFGGIIFSKSSLAVRNKLLNFTSDLVCHCYEYKYV